MVECSDETLFTGEMKFHDAIERINASSRRQAPDQDHVEFKCDYVAFGVFATYFFIF